MREGSKLFFAGLAGFATGLGTKVLVDAMGTPAPPADHVTLVNKFTFLHSENGTPETLKPPICTQVNSIPIAGQPKPDMASFWKFIDILGFPRISLGVYTWWGGKAPSNPNGVYTVALCRCSSGKLDVIISDPQPQQGTGPWGFAKMAGWGVIEPGIVVLSWPVP